MTLSALRAMCADRQPQIPGGHMITRMPALWFELTGSNPYQPAVDAAAQAYRDALARRDSRDQNHAYRALVDAMSLKLSAELRR